MCWFKISEIELNFLQLIVDPSGPALDLHVPLLVIIGTIPLRAIVQQYQTQYGISGPGPSQLPPAGPEPTAPPMGGASADMDLREKTEKYRLAIIMVIYLLKFVQHLLINIFYLNYVNRNIMKIDFGINSDQMAKYIYAV